MSTDPFIPELWKAELLVALRPSLVYGQPTVSNTDYEGEIREKGDTVRATTIGRPTISDYDEATTEIDPEDLDTAQRTFTITQAKMFAFKIGDIERAQSANGGALMAAAMSESAFGLADVADRFLASLYTQVIAANQLGTVTVGSANPERAYEQILVPLGVKLDEANVPKIGRYCIMPPWLHGRLLLDSRFVKVNESGTETGLRNGIVGRAAGFDILTSNSTPNPTADHNVVLAGVPQALCYAEQISDVETYRSHKKFANVVRGLHVYGGKIMRPEMVATAVADPTA